VLNNPDRSGKIHCQKTYPKNVHSICVRVIQLHTVQLINYHSKKNMAFFDQPINPNKCGPLLLRIQTIEIPEECFVRVACTPAIHDKFVRVQTCNPSVTSIPKLDNASNTEQSNAQYRILVALYEN
jgi:hypothetical protein